MGIHNQNYEEPGGAASPGGLHRDGPVLNVQIEVAAALAAQIQQANQTLPQPVTGFALIDTGATFSAIDNSVATQLGLQPVGVANVGGAAGVQQHSLFRAAYSFPGASFPGFEHGRLVGVDLAGQVAPIAGGPMIALIGRDILQNFVMIYNGPHGMFTLAH